MAIRTILVPVGSAQDVSERIKTAFLVGTKLNAHVDVFHISPDPRDSVAYVGEGVTGAIIEDLMTAAEQESSARATRSETQYRAVVRDFGAVQTNDPKVSGFSTSFSKATGRVYDLVALRGRLADLVAVARPKKGDDAMVQATLEVALMETGRAVLVTPPTAPTTVGDNVMILWSGAEEAARAVAAALPVLRLAKKITAASFGNYARAPAMAADLARYLAWHDIQATADEVATAGRALEESVLEKIRSSGTDLLVMGAYSHSRLRHLIFGGVTSAILEQASIPVLMAH
ncbi:MAG: universal stress protein [Alphaproteobacteria bacterium]|nr:universal stress protein [Alphaproteobacteria bacterium]